MWDPLVHEFPKTVHGFRCMLANKYLLAVESKYAPDTLGYELIRDCIGVVRSRNYEQATSRYRDIYTRLQGATEAELQQSVQERCCCPHCPRHKKADMGESAHVQKAHDVQAVQKP